MRFVYSDLLLLYKTVSNEEELGSFGRLFLYHTRDFTVLVRILSILIYRVYNKKSNLRISTEICCVLKHKAPGNLN